MLVGRDADLAALRALLTEDRLVTVTGAGGVGKTSLALAVADGAPLCELARVEPPEQVAAAVAEALGFPSLDAAMVGLVQAQRLLVLDNCEHLLDAAADAAARLISECSGATVLATSREPLDLPGERVLRLAPLAVPAGDDPAQLPDSPAVALLLARARDAGTEVAVDAGSAAAIAALCRRLDGLPLAIELAAARTRSLTPAEILAHLEHRLDLLARPRERGPARQPGGGDCLVARAAAGAVPAVLRSAGCLQRPIHGGGGAGGGRRAGRGPAARGRAPGPAGRTVDADRAPARRPQLVWPARHAPRVRPHPADRAR